MYEVECKVRADHESVRTRLAELVGSSLGSVEQSDTYYNAPNRNFAETDEALRVREERAENTVETLLTYKGPLVDSESKTREEAETAVSDPEAIRSILAGLGYEPAATVHKKRERYTVDGVTVTLDHVENLGEFVEAELDVEDGIDEARGRVTEVLEELGIDPDEQIRISYLGLLLADDSL
jgi:adenylate cyclase class 2